MGTAFDSGRLEQIRLEIGSGENRFSMKRGSFVYKQKSKGFRSMQFLEKADTVDGFELRYRDPITEQTVCLCVKQEEKRLNVCWKGDVPEGVNRFRLSFPTDAEEHIYGCGETYSKLDLKGELVRIWVAMPEEWLVF